MLSLLQQSALFLAFLYVIAIIFIIYAFKCKNKRYKVGGRKKDDK